MMYLIPVVAIAGMLVYVFWYQARMRQAVAAGHGPIIFHNTFAGYFTSIGEDEFIIALWQGLAYTGDQSTAAKLGGAVLNGIRSKATGVSSYTPYTFVALTSRGRLLIAEEYSESKQRGHYRELLAMGPGTIAVTGTAALPEHQGVAPTNPFNPAVPLELVRVSSASGEHGCWLSVHSLEVTGQQRPINAVLPTSAEAASAVWQRAFAQAQPAA